MGLCLQPYVMLKAIQAWSLQILRKSFLNTTARRLLAPALFCFQEHPWCRLRRAEAGFRTFGADCLLFASLYLSLSISIYLYCTNLNHIQFICL
jgi:hypothetical protein